MLFSALLLVYSAHVMALVLHGQRPTESEFAYLVPIAICFVGGWVSQLKRKKNTYSIRPAPADQRTVDDDELDELISQRKAEEESEADRLLLEQERHRREEDNFLRGIQEWQARQRLSNYK